MNTTWELFVHGLKTMLNAENKLVHALGEMAQESKTPELRQAYSQHRKQTEGHAKRLIDIMRDLGESPEQLEAAGIEGLIEEKKSFMKEHPAEDILEVFNISAGIKAERYELSAYESLINMAQELGALKSASLLKENLGEEEEALEKLKEFSGRIKPKLLGVKGSPEGGLPRKAA